MSWGVVNLLVVSEVAYTASGAGSWPAIPHIDTSSPPAVVAAADTAFSLGQRLLPAGYRHTRCTPFARFTPEDDVWAIAASRIASSWRCPSTINQIPSVLALP